jgi:peroxiredoxin
MTTLVSRDTPLTAGDAAPMFTLDTAAREPWSLAEALDSGDVVLSFFPFAFTGVCGTEMECLTKELARFTSESATVVGISCDSTPALAAWSEQLGLTHTMLSDIRREVCRAFGVYWAEAHVSGRATFIIKGGDSADRGTIAWAQVRDIPQALDFDEVLAALS